MFYNLNNEKQILKIQNQHVSIDSPSRIQSYIQLIKFRLSALVVFSAAIGYLMAANGLVEYPKMIILIIGGFLITGAANGFNQVIEKDLDKLMDRTKNRPLPSGHINYVEAILLCFVMAVSGIFLLGYFMNWQTALLGGLAVMSYAFVYTPMKQISSFAVYIGALPGALPTLIGWVAYDGTFGSEALILFLIQFMWQFPHFWAIAWVLDDDYKKAGFRLLPSEGGRNKNSATQTLVSTLLLVAISFIPLIFDWAGIGYAVICGIAGSIFIYQSVKLYLTCQVKEASRLMFGSFLYLPIIQISLLVQKLM